MTEAVSHAGDARASVPADRERRTGSLPGAFPGVKGWSKQAVEARQEARRLELEAELVRLRDLLAARPEVRSIILFGSLAAGIPGESSDLDLAVVAESDLPFLDRYTEYICCLKPRVSLDLLVYTPGEWRDLVTDSHFVQRISGEGRVLYETAA